MPIAVEIAGLRKAYRTGPLWASREVVAVDSADLQIEQGQITALLGANGAGKTTTVKMIAGLVLPEAGRISFPAFGGRPRIGAVLEGSRNLYWRLSAWENIRYFGELKGLSLSTLRTQSDELLAIFGLQEARNRAAQALSRGMQQKLAVILALLGDPQLLLLDEPTLGLDVESSLNIQAVLRRFASERGITILITTHQMELAQSLCRSVAIMRKGRIAVHRPVSELIDHFQRQDFVLRIPESEYKKVLSAVAQYSVLEEPEQRAGQRSLRVQLATASDVYPLMRTLESAQVELLDFRQATPTLEEVFVAVTSGGMELQGGEGEPQ